MKYRSRTIIEATQWHRNGDHPKDHDAERVGLENGEARTWTGAECKALGWEGGVVRYFRHPQVSGNKKCGMCGHIMHLHGWIDFPPNGQTVCPGDWVITTDQGGYETMANSSFQADYEPT